MSEYQSSEELQRASREAFVDEAAKKKQQKEQTLKDKMLKVLDKYIAEHSDSTKIRKMAKEADRTADAQLDLSADLVELLREIKKGLR